MELNLSIFVL